MKEEILAGLKSAESDVSRQVQAARAEASKRIAAARRDAARLVDDAVQQARHEAESALSEQAARLQTDRAAILAQGAARQEALRAHFEAGAGEAVERAVKIIEEDSRA